MAADEESAPEQPTAPKEITFHFIKASGFRVIHVDGVHGGVTPRGQIQMAVFSERNPIPQKTVHPVSKDGLGAEDRDKRVQREGVVREVEAELVMSLEAAASVAKWLSDNVERLKNAIREH